MHNRTGVILAGGKGTRLEPLTSTIPKPLIKVASKPILEHTLSSLSPYVDAFVIVVGYMSELVRAEFGDSFDGKPISYVIQDQQLGTGHALSITEKLIKTDSFFLTYGDDIYDPIIFTEAVKYDRCIVGKVSKDWHLFGVLHSDERGKLHEIIEKPKEFVGDAVNIGVYLLDKKIFPYFEQTKLSIRGEYELTDIVTLYSRDHEVMVSRTEGHWLTIGYPWHILQAHEVLLPKTERAVLGAIEEFVVIKGNVRIGEGTVTKSGTYIDGNVIIGRNCVIGPHTYIRGNVVIGDNCKIGSSVEIEHSVIGDKVNIEHLSFIGYSVLGNNIILGGGTVTADRRHDRSNIRVNIKEQLIETGMTHLGAIIGDFVRTGINTSIYPGRKLAYHSYTVPGEVVKQDKLSSHDMKLK